MSRLFLLLSLLTACLLDHAASANSRGRGVSTTKPTCPYPEVSKVADENQSNIINLHKHAADIWFDGALRLQLKRPCKLKCINGEWVGPLCQTVDGDNKYHPVYKSCTTYIFRTNFVVSHDNKTVSGNREFAHNTRVEVRCREFGLYKLIGETRVSCHNGHWKPRIPSCIPTSLLHNFTDDSSPPTVQVRITAGSASVEPSGLVAVYPGSVIHLECLHARSQGEPEWSWTSAYRTYPTGWSIAPDERGWKYRLSIYYVKPQDTGIYTCATPKGLTHSVILNVVAVQCDASKVVSTDPHLLIHVEGSRLGQNIQFSCSDGFKLIGFPNSTCQASGIWSADPPQCLPMVCPKIEIPRDQTVKIIHQESHFGGKTVFECPAGYKLQGSKVLTCGPNEEWSGDIPDCKEINCAPPLIPQNGKLEYANESASFPYRARAIVTFSCKGVFQLVGESSIVCTDLGYWSNPPPFCRPRCPPFSQVSNGEFKPKKEWYDIGDRTLLVCEDGYDATSRVRPRCLKSGQWSDVGLECRLNRHKMKLILRGMQTTVGTSAASTNDYDMEEETNSSAIHNQNATPVYREA